MKIKMPLWARPCRKRKKWREMRDAALDACRRLKLNPNIHGKVIYEVISGCVHEDAGQVMAAASLLGGFGELSALNRVLRR